MSRHRAHDSHRQIMLCLAIPSAAIYLLLGLAGDLRDKLALYWLAHALLLALAFAAWSRTSKGHRSLTLALGAALLFRLLAATGAPALSDDVYRYVWDGRLQLSGVHPYLHAPDAPALEPLRDRDWERINHPEIRTIYPPGAQVLFFLMVLPGAGPLGVKLALALFDFGVVLALAHLLRRLRLPSDRVLLYAWNPLAIMESGGSGHIEPAGVLLLLIGLAWLADGAGKRALAALALAIQIKLLPLLLLPFQLRRAGIRAIWVLPMALLLPWLPYLFGGPPVGDGIVDYAARWEYNSTVFAALQLAGERIDTGALLTRWVARAESEMGALPWERLYPFVWPRETAKIAVICLLLAWVAYRWLRPQRDPLRESLALIGAALLLSPTLHPWYLLWLLPLAAATAGWPWLLLGATVPLAYHNVDGEVPWSIRTLEYLPPLLLALWVARRGRRDGA